MKYCQLTNDERYLISQLRKAKCSVAKIAEVLGRHRSTIYREIKRNLTPCPNGGHYCHSKAQERRNGRLRRSRRGPHHAPWQYERVEELLMQQWSPEQIAAVLRKNGNPPIFSSRQKWSYAASANFCIGVMPPSAMLGRS